MSKAFVNIVLAVSLCTAVNAQKQLKPWTDWTKSDVEKILNDSPWGQTQIDTDTSEMVYTPTTRSGGGDSVPTIQARTAIFVQPAAGQLEVSRDDLDANAVAAPAAGGKVGSPGAHEWVKHRIAGEAKHPD